MWIKSDRMSHLECLIYIFIAFLRKSSPPPPEREKIKLFKYNKAQLQNKSTEQRITIWVFQMCQRRLRPASHPGSLPTVPKRSFPVVLSGGAAVARTKNAKIV